MSKEDRIILTNAKLLWRLQMRNHFGSSWTKRKANRRDSSGRLMMNIPV